MARPRLRIIDVKYSRRCLPGTWAELVCDGGFRTSNAVASAFAKQMDGRPREEFWALYLDGRHASLGALQVSVGILTASLVHPREVFAPALRLGAAGIIVVHNHPSGDPEPSPEDREVTRRLEQVGELVGIRLLDHVVLGGPGRYTSFLERGWLRTP